MSQPTILSRSILSLLCSPSRTKTLASVGACVVAAGFCNAEDPKSARAESARESSFQYLLPVSPVFPYAGFAELFMSGAYDQNAAPPPPPRTATTSLSAPTVYISQPQTYNSPESAPTMTSRQETGGQARGAHPQADNGPTTRAGHTGRAHDREDDRGTDRTPPPKFRTKSSGGSELRHERESNPSEKEIIPAQPERSLFSLSATGGYYSRYLFRGLDVSHRTGIDGGTETGFFGSSVAATIGDFALSFWYEESLEKYVPGGAGADGSFGKLTQLKNRQAVFANPLDFRTPAPVRYQEYDLFANYTFHLTHDLALTAGANFYWFNDGRFWATGSHHVNNSIEAATALTWTGIPYVNQSLNYIYDFDAFKGGFLSYTLAANPIRIYKSPNGPFSIHAVPGVTVAYDFRYNGSNNGWNNVAPSLDVPIRLTDGLVLNLGAYYTHDLGDASISANGQGVQRTDNRFWFSAALQFTPDFSGRSERAVARDWKGILPDKSMVEEDPGRWRVSAGAGVRMIRSSFNVGPAAPYNINPLFSRKAGGGDLGFASDTKDVTYLNGSVFGTQNFIDGTSEFTVKSASQITDDGKHGDGGINRQITYMSERYDYTQHSDRHGFNAGDDDAVVYPYLSLSYDVLKRDNLSASIGFGYAYNHSSMDSGTRLVGLQTATEQHSTSLFTYNVDELFSTNNAIQTPFDSRTATTGNYYLIYDAAQYNTRYGTGHVPPQPDLSQLGPQKNQIDTKQVVATVAAFRAAKLDVDLHSVSMPFDFTVDITSRIHARVSAGPTLNIFNEDLRTETNYQLLPAGNIQVVKNDTARNIYTSPYSSDANDNKALRTNIVPNNVPKPTSTPINASATTANAAPGGGKGSSEGQSRSLPGKNLARTVNHQSGQDIQLGVFGQATLQLDLDSHKRWFVEVYARYDYVPNFSVSDGATSTLIDASSWGSGIGVGLRF